MPVAASRSSILRGRINRSRLHLILPSRFRPQKWLPTSEVQLKPWLTRARLALVAKLPTCSALSAALARTRDLRRRPRPRARPAVTSPSPTAQLFWRATPLPEARPHALIALAARRTETALPGAATRTATSEVPSGEPSWRRRHAATIVCGMRKKVARQGTVSSTSSSAQVARRGVPGCRRTR